MEMLFLVCPSHQYVIYVTLLPRNSLQNWIHDLLEHGRCTSHTKRQSSELVQPFVGVDYHKLLCRHKLYTQFILCRGGGGAQPPRISPWSIMPINLYRLTCYIQSTYNQHSTLFFCLVCRLPFIPGIAIINAISIYPAWHPEVPNLPLLSLNQLCCRCGQHLSGIHFLWRLCKIPNSVPSYKK